MTTAQRRAREYRALRLARGSQSQVAKLLGIDPQTISRRERGEIPVSVEAMRAMESIAVRKSQ